MKHNGNDVTPKIVCRVDIRNVTTIAYIYAVGDVKETKRNYRT